MKRLLSLAIAVGLMLVLVLSLTGCQKPETTPTPIPSDQVEQSNIKAGENYRVLVWSTTRENMPLESNQPGSSELRIKVEGLEDKYGITITYVKATSNWLDDAKSASASHEPLCEVLHAGQPGALPGLYSYDGMVGNIVVSISDLGMEDYFSDAEYWNTETMQACGYYADELYFVVPNQIGFASVGLNQVAFVNFNMLAAAGYTREEVFALSDSGNWTFDALREMCIATTNPDNDVYGMCLGAGSVALCSMVASNGGQFLTKVDGVDRFTATDSKVLKAVDFFVSMARDDKTVYMNEYTDTEITGFGAGKYAVMLTYANRAEQMSGVSDVDYGIILPPKGPDAQDYISEVNWYDAYCVMSGSKNVKGAVEFMSLILPPNYAKSSEENTQLIVAEASVYLRDNESIDNLFVARDNSFTTTYQVYCWLNSNDTGFGFGNAILYCCKDFVDGSVTPSVYYESVTDAANGLIDYYFRTKS